MTMQEFADQHNVYVALDHYGTYQWHTLKPSIDVYRGKWYIVGVTGTSGTVPPGVEKDENISWEESLISPKPSVYNLKQDQPIMVRNFESDVWESRHFCGIFKIEHQIVTYQDGATSFTNLSAPVSWNFWRLPTEEELRGTSWENNNE